MSCLPLTGCHHHGDPRRGLQGDLVPLWITPPARSDRLPAQTIRPAVQGSGRIDEDLGGFDGGPDGAAVGEVEGGDGGGGDFGDEGDGAGAKDADAVAGDVEGFGGGGPDVAGGPFGVGAVEGDGAGVDDGEDLAALMVVPAGGDELGAARQLDSAVGGVDAAAEQVEAAPLQPVGGALPRLGAREAPGAQAEGDVVEGGQVREQQVVLEHHPDGALLGRDPDPVGGSLQHNAVEQHLPGLHWDQPGQGAQQGG